jgi:hypothetical protein
VIDKVHEGLDHRMGPFVQRTATIEGLLPRV